MTSDESILNVMRGKHLQFATVPNQILLSNKFKFTPTENTGINEEIQMLQQKKKKKKKKKREIWDDFKSEKS